MGAKDASADNKSTFDEIRRMEISLKGFVETTIQKNNLLIKSTMETPIIAKIV